jgi:hypothetical protein
VTKIKTYRVFESYKGQEQKDQEQLDLILKSMDQWRNFYLELPDKKKENYLNHFHIEEFIKKNTADMLVLLKPLENDKILIEWVNKRKDKFPYDFVKIFGVSNDLKELGF